jgi:hypothetical protein
MNWVSGSASTGASRIWSSDSGVRRHAFSFFEPLRKALAATFASVSREMPCSCM